MLQTLIGALIGGALGAVPGVILFFVNSERFWTIKVVFVLLTGTAAIVGAIAGSTTAILATFKKHRRSSGSGERVISLAKREDGPAALDP